MTKPLWYCPLCNAEGADPQQKFCPDDGAQVRPMSERGAEWIDREIDGKYRVVRFLGAGGMAEVFEAKRLDSDKVIALKFLHASLSSNDDLNERIRREAQMISLIAHPNVVALQDFGNLEDGRYYMAMELLSGQSLDAAIMSKRVSPRLACQIVLQTCEGLAAAHEREVIHRDIKPENLFLQDAPEGGDPIVKILDLGVGKLQGKAASASLTRAGTIFGTPAYMAPEQCMGQEVTPAADIYSLGVVLYEMLQGRPPFTAEDYISVLTQQISEAPVWNEVIANERGVPAEAEDVVLRAMSKSPADRQESMLELQSDVAGLLSRMRHGSRYSVPPSRRTSTPPPRSGPSRQIVPLKPGAGNDNQVVEFASGVYWVGRKQGNHLECNSYLRVFQNGNSQISLLIDPGPPQDFEVISQKVQSVLGSLDNLDYIFLNHQDPDVALNAATIQQKNSRVHIFCSEDTFRLARYYGLDPERQTSTEHIPGGRTWFSTGHAVYFVPTPFCHSRGAVMLYDPQSSVLFSGDLFGGTNAHGELLADAPSLPGIDLFHELYMPSGRALQRAIGQVRNLEPRPRWIAPQHGALIDAPRIPEVLDHVGALTVGIDLLESNESDPRHLKTANDMVQAYVRAVGSQNAKALIHRYTIDGDLSHIFSLNEPFEVVSIRVEPQLALKTLFHDAIESAPAESRQEATDALARILSRHLSQ